ncbi:hypothetical protein BK826_08845 [Rothia kristinae]|uniref:Putative host cell surface-exposed lipoprotein Ltp-like HTH region domain-containing protein n=1 Tax=Rothia kristinae TaxID=37923 RepID=A0A1S2MZT3_9MICC|nr:Ltp family lipoprotein [Rothia kristinae]OIJ35165.1 hypothetical protein BK826_08845 [Rothia kristinae]
MSENPHGSHPSQEPTPEGYPTPTHQSGEQQAGYPQAPYGAPQVAPQSKARNVVGIIAMVCAILGTILACIPGILALGWILLPVGFIMGIVAVCLKGKVKWQGITAIIVSVVGTLIGFLVFFLVFANAVNDAIQDSDTSPSPLYSSSSDASPTVAPVEPAPETSTADVQAGAEQTTAPAEPVQTAEETAAEAQSSDSSTDDGVPQEYRSALTKAETYVDMMHMSQQGVYEQLTSEYGEKFSAEAAQYAIENLDVDWNEVALKKAEDYQKEMAMSPDSIYDQLTSDFGEKFTPEQARYAVDHLSK